MHRSRQHSIGKKVCAVVLGTLASIAFGEVLVRVVLPAPTVKAIELGADNCVYQRSSNPILGFELKANYRNEDPDFIESYERTNSHGLRDDERSHDKPNGVSRVLLLGDSVVEGYGLRQQDTISHQLQALYKDKRTEVLNFGVSAYCTLAEIELLATKGIEFAPDHVVLVFVENDFDNFNREAFPLSGTIDRPAWVEVLFKYSHLWRRACLQFNLFQFRAESDPVAWNKQAIGDNNVSVGLERFRSLADEYQFQPLIAVWPRFLNDRIENVPTMPGGEKLIIEALAAKHRIPSFRLSPYFETALAAMSSATTQSVSPRLVFSQGDELHPSPEGARVAAQAIYEVVQRGIVDPATASVTDTEMAKVDAALAKLGASSPNYARVYNRVGNDHLKRGQFDKAIEQYEKALGEDPSNAAAHNNLGIALERSGGAGAIQHYRQAVQARPDFAEAHFNLGNALEPSDRSEAQKHFIEAIKSQPDFVAAHFSLSRSMLRDGRLKAAESGFCEVLKLDASHADALRLLGKELAKQRRLPEARIYFERLILIEPQNAEALNNLGAICSALGEPSVAIKHFKAAVAADPNHPKATQNLKTLLGRPGR